MHLCMLADVPGWCFDRTAQAMKKFHATANRWSVVFADPNKGVVLEDGSFQLKVPDADIYRVGGVPLFFWFLDSNRLPDRKCFVPTFASFWDTRDFAARLRQVQSYLLAVIVNDLRQLPVAVTVGVPVIYSPDRVDPDIFHPVLEGRPDEGPLRVGWAGSVKYWKGVKHPDEVAKVCAKHPDKLFYVRQDRELDGAKNATQMNHWYNGLDILITPNDAMTCTPVTQLEAIACGVAVATTRCGETWPLIKAELPDHILEQPTAECIEATLLKLWEKGRAQLRDSAMGFLKKYGQDFILWECGEAQRATRAIAALM